MEIGLGGRLDAFNVVDADIAVITSIGLDHQEYLGDTLDQIGAEKAGILRAAPQQVVLGTDMPQSVFAACEHLSLQPIQIGADFQISADPQQAYLAVCRCRVKCSKRFPWAACPAIT